MQQQAYRKKNCSKQGFKEEANWKITNLKKRVKMGGGMMWKCHLWTKSEYDKSMQ